MKLKVGELNNEIIKKHLQEGETTYFDICERICKELNITDKIEKHLPLDEFFKCFVPSFPVLHNVYKGSKKLPFACYILDVDDNYQDIIYANAKIAHLTRLGGGIGLNVSNIREKGAKIKSSGQKTNGLIPFIKMFEATINAFNQGSERKGSIAFYCDIDHPEILDFMKLDTFDGGDHNLKLSMKIAQLGVNISDEFMELTQKWIDTGEDQQFTLKSRAGEEDKTLNIQDFWETLIQQRIRTGKPYIMFSDTVNRDGKKDGYLKDGEKIACPNLCTEVLIKTRNLTDNRSGIGICCLGSINLPYAIPFTTSDKAKKDLHQAVCVFFEGLLAYSKKKVQELDLEDLKFKKDLLTAISQKNIGLGCFGFMDAMQYNIYSYLDATESCTDKKPLIGKFKNRTHAIAPTATTARIFTASPSIDNHPASSYKYQSLAGVTDVEVPYLDSKDDDIFKRFKTIDNKKHIDICASFTKKIDQAVSCSLRYANNVDVNVIFEDIIYSWKQGLRTLYYCEVDNKDITQVQNPLDQQQEDLKSACDIRNSNCEFCEN